MSLSHCLPLVLAAALLSGCASMSEKECLTVDWREQGQRDGQNGYPLSRIEEHREACAKVRVAPDLAAYRAGRDVGIQQYCTRSNGIEQGRHGRSYRNACPAQLEPAFLEGHRAGSRVHQAQQRADQLQNNLYSKQSELDRAKDDAARKRLREELRLLDQRLRSAREEINDAERRLRY